jgi:ribosome-associated translation inhibitor RaiA
MNQAQRRNDFPIQIDCHQCTVSQAEINKMRTAAASLARQVGHFPIASLHVLIARNARSNDFSVKTDLFLSGGTLVSGEHDPLPYTAFERCLDKLTDELKAYKDRLGRVPERQKVEKATRQPVQPSALPDQAAIDAAVRDGDYAAFRVAAFPFEEPVRRRVGRWVERYPEMDAQIGKRLQIADIVEGVFLDAFENHATRPKTDSFGEWLERLMDRAVRELLKKPDAELENIRLARTVLAAEQGADAV